MADKEGAEAAKAEANNYFKEHKYQKAIELYSRAIELDSSNHVYYANRAFAHIKTEAFGAALADASEAIRIEPGYSKGYYRRGTAYFALMKFKEALRDFGKVCKMSPKDKDAKAKYKQCEKAIKEAAFFEAIFMEDKDVDPFEEFGDYDSIVVEPEYTGPHLGETVTHEFCMDLLKHFEGQGKLHKKYALQLLKKVRDIYKAEPTLLEVPVDDHFTVCGDVHGQFYDFANIFKINGPPSEENPYLFNGDFIDRGSFGVEVILSMFAFKCAHPTAFFMTRGNHESKNMNTMYGFSGEVAAKYTATMMAIFQDIFCSLPLALCLGEKVLCVHGGLFSKDGVTLDDIRKIDRFREPPDEGLMCELLWADPQPFNGRAPSKRGVGLAFGPDVTKRFLDDNNLEMLVRSHEVKDEGYQVEADGRLVTVFSAPNYCDQIGNKGAFIRFDSQCKPHYTSFAAVPHPPIRPMHYASGNMFGM